MTPGFPERLKVAQEALCRMDDQARFTEVNAPCAALLGREPAELLGRTLWDVFPRASSSALEQAVQAGLREGQARQLELGPEVLGRWLDVSLYPEACSAQSGGLLLHLRDVHGRKLAELRADRLQAVTEALAGAMTLAEVVEVILEAATPATDAEAGAVLSLSEDRQVLQLLGQQGHPAEVASLFTRLPMDATTPLTQAARSGEALYLPGQTLPREYPHMGQQAALRRYGLHVALPLSAGGQTVGVWQLSFLHGDPLGEVERGFTETLARLSALALARAQLHAGLERAVEKRTARLHELNSEMRAYAGAVSHDIGPSLRRVRDFADVLSRRLLPQLGPDEARFFEHIQTESERMTRLIDDLSTFVASGQEDVRFANVPLSQLFEAARTDLAPLLRQRQVVWTVRPLPTVRGNAPLLRQVFAALLSNALKFTRERHPAAIEVGAERGEREWTVWVRDNGSGFAPGTASGLFHTRERGDDGRASQRPGAALGLANVRRIVAKHGGRVWATSTPGEGATFFFSLPEQPGPHGD